MSRVDRAAKSRFESHSSSWAASMSRSRFNPGSLPWRAELTSVMRITPQPWTRTTRGDTALAGVAPWGPSEGIPPGPVLVSQSVPVVPVVTL